MTFQDTLWLFNIAMENCPFTDDFPIKTSICKGFSIAMLNNQRVFRKNIRNHPKPTILLDQLLSALFGFLALVLLEGLPRLDVSARSGFTNFHWCPKSPQRWPRDSRGVCRNLRHPQTEMKALGNWPNESKWAQSHHCKSNVHGKRYQISDLNQPNCDFRPTKWWWDKTVDWGLRQSTCGFSQYPN